MEFVVIHYTEEPNFILHKIEIENSPIFPRTKPKGGIWTSPAGSEFGWDKWCWAEHYGDIDNLIKIEMIIDVDERDEKKNLIVIDNEKDLYKLMWDIDPAVKRFFSLPGFNVSFGMEFIDFVVMKEKGIDAIWLTWKGMLGTRATFPRNLLGWDCETVLILHERCIESWSWKCTR